jgi:D-alanyl-D-alanine carboxypeptidase-like protein
MATLKSQNGWPVLDTRPAYTKVPGTSLKLAVRPGDVAVIFTELVRRFDNEVEDVDQVGHPFDGADKVPAGAGAGGSKVFDDWSWAVRNVRGSKTTITNHASGTAIDLNATQHPRGVSGTFTRAQVTAVRKILAAFFDPTAGRSVVRWGHDYSSASTVDSMHFEINANAAAVKRVADKIRKAQAVPAKPAAPTPAPTTVQAPITLGGLMFLASVPGADPRVFLVTGGGKLHVPNTTVQAELVRCGVPNKGDVSSATLNMFPDLAGVPANAAAAAVGVNALLTRPQTDVAALVAALRTDLVGRLDALATAGADDATSAQLAEARTALVAQLDELETAVSDDASAAQVAEVKTLVESLVTPPAEEEEPVDPDPPVEGEPEDEEPETPEVPAQNGPTSQS